MNKKAYNFMVIDRENVCSIKVFQSMEEIFKHIRDFSHETDFLKDLLTSSVKDIYDANNYDFIEFNKSLIVILEDNRVFEVYNQTDINFNDIQNERIKGYIIDYDTIVYHDEKFNKLYNYLKNKLGFEGFIASDVAQDILKILEV